jgi:hypothetical protein
MKKILRKYILCLRLWFIRRMGYKLPSLREASSAAPNQLYDHFGLVVEAVRRKGKIETMKGVNNEEIPYRCITCALFNQHIPCTFNHRMANGKDICEDYRFEIICVNHGSI